MANNDKQLIDQARADLYEIIHELGWNLKHLAAKSGIHYSIIYRFLGNPDKELPPTNGISAASALRVSQALFAAGIDRERRRSFLSNVGAVELVDLPSPTVEEKETSTSELQVEVPLNVLVEIGVSLDCHGQASSAASVLSYLVAPQGKGALIRSLKSSRDITAYIAAAVASGHLGHALLDTGASALATQCFNQALALLEESFGAGSRSQLKSWERWQIVTGRSHKDFELWCIQMLGVTKRLTESKRRDVDEAVGRLLYVAENAKRAQMDPNLIRANALRDLAAVKMKLNPTSQKAGDDLNESVSRLSDASDLAMLAMSLLKRAGWHKSQFELANMEKDVIAGLAILPDLGNVVRANALNAAAELYVDIEPALASRLADEALRLSLEGGFGREQQQAETVLRESSS